MRYRLRSTWLLAAPVGTCWDVLADPTMSWPRWWQGVTASGVEPRSSLVGSTADVAFRAGIGYTLRLHLVVGAATPPLRVLLRASGDLVGTADVTLEPVDPALTRVEIDWDVRTTRAWMNALGPVLARPFAASHAAVMRSGERGLTAYLAR